MQCKQSAAHPDFLDAQAVGFRIHSGGALNFWLLAHWTGNVCECECVIGRALWTRLQSESNYVSAVCDSWFDTISSGNSLLKGHCESASMKTSAGWMALCVRPCAGSSTCHMKGQAITQKSGSKGGWLSAPLSFGFLCNFISCIWWILAVKSIHAFTSDSPSRKSLQMCRQMHEKDLQEGFESSLNVDTKSLKWLNLPFEPEWVAKARLNWDGSISSGFSVSIINRYNLKWSTVQCTAMMHLIFKCRLWRFRHTWCLYSWKKSARTAGVIFRYQKEAVKKDEDKTNFWTQVVPCSSSFCHQYVNAWKCQTV